MIHRLQGLTEVPVVLTTGVTGRPSAGGAISAAHVIANAAEFALLVLGQQDTSPNRLAEVEARRQAATAAVSKNPGDRKALIDLGRASCDYFDTSTGLGRKAKEGELRKAFQEISSVEELLRAQAGNDGYALLMADYFKMRALGFAGENALQNPSLGNAGGDLDRLWQSLRLAENLAKIDPAQYKNSKETEYPYQVESAHNVKISALVNQGAIRYRADQKSAEYKPAEAPPLFIQAITESIAGVDLGGVKTTPGNPITPRLFYIEAKKALGDEASLREAKETLEQITKLMNRAPLKFERHLSEVLLTWTNELRVTFAMEPLTREQVQPFLKG